MSSSFMTSETVIGRFLGCLSSGERRAVRRRKSSRRRGASVVEVAFVMPVFLLFVFFIMQFGHAYMVRNMLNAACRNAARFGSTSGVSTSEAEGRAYQILSPIASTDEVDLIVKDASMLDAGETVPTSSDECNNLDDIELSEAIPRHPFLVRAQVRYGDVAFTIVPGFADLPIVGRAVTRHE
jgi:TadE-like protein